MVKISVDEGYAFDILSIYEELKAQLGQEKLSEIINSSEYDELYTENQTTFVLVDAIRASDENSIGKDIDLNNLRRFECKRKLHNKFFDSQMLETKTKYE
jgi:hypothetical protein